MPTSDLADVIARTRADLLALADRVEREEPSTRLDGWIAEMFFDGQHIPPYTTSLDAAASLVPPAWFVDEIRDFDDPDGAWSCRLMHRLLPHKAWGNAHTEPRARTAAALRARAQEMKDDR